jgi:ATP-dependent RNA helicase DeaD
MSLSDFASSIPPALLAAISGRGYTELTGVQRAVLEPVCEGRDLRITSQTGSGKTVAIGLSLRALVVEACPADKGIARPRALVVAPTRELARQVEQELAWLFAGTAGRIASATGGASYREERAALGKGPSIVVGTPGRLLDHLNRGAIDPSRVGAVVLDEADRMLDLGFRAELEGILACVPTERRTHLVSATFPREVRSLAERIQRDPVHVEGTRLGVANVDIDHVIHIVEPGQRFDAIVNLLLDSPEAQTLVFVRTRADAAAITTKLVSLRFAASSLSGEMDQAARNRALAGFKRGDLKVLIATDVAARGIDVQDITRVIHVEPPTHGDSYTHRSGRTGRAGRKGISSLLVAPQGVVHATRLLRGLGVPHRFEPIPSAEQLRRAADDRILTELSADDASAASTDQRGLALATRLIQAGNLERTITRLLARCHYAGVTEPREVRAPRAVPEPQRAASRTRRRPDTNGSGAPGAARGWVPFRVSWGQQHGADARRLLAIACRRGDIAGSDVGAIRIERTFAIVNVASEAAEAFANRAGERDARDPRIVIRRDTLSGHTQESSPVEPLRGKPSTKWGGRPPFKSGSGNAKKTGDKPFARRGPKKAQA